jgi:hypothetical protein
MNAIDNINLFLPIHWRLVVNPTTLNAKTHIILMVSNANNGQNPRKKQFSSLVTVPTDDPSSDPLLYTLNNDFTEDIC